MLRNVAARRLWVVRGERGGQAASVFVEAASQWEAAYLAAGEGLRIVVVADAVPFDLPGLGRGAGASFFVASPSPRRRRQTTVAFHAGRAFGRPVTAGQRAVFMAAGVAVAVLNLWLPWGPR